MKNTVKIVILISALVFLSGATLSLLRLTTKPPTDKINVNRFEEAINDDINSTTGDLSVSDLDNAFRLVDREIIQWGNNGLIPPEGFDRCTERFLQTYIPVYCQTTKNDLSSSSGYKWGTKRRNAILAHLSYLRSKSYKSVSSKIVDASLAQDLSDVEKICSNYTIAKNLVADTSYSSIDNSIKRINEAHDFSNDVYIGNSDLAVRLAAFPGALGDSHYDYICSLFSKLRDWRNYSLYLTESNYATFKDACSVYSSTSIYGTPHPHSLSEMLDHAADYMQYAYDEKCYLMVDNSSSDMSYTFDSRSSNYTFEVSTDHPDGYKVQIPSFCSLYEKNQSSFIVSTTSNNTSSNRSGQIIVTVGNRTVIVTVTQPSDTKCSITSVTTDHGITQNSQKGMRINVGLSANGYNGRRLEVVAWFYYQNGNRLDDKNGQLKSTDGQVAVNTFITPYSNSYNSSVNLFMPISELHVSTKYGKVELKYKVAVFDNGNKLAESDFQEFYVY